MSIPRIVIRLYFTFVHPVPNVGFSISYRWHIGNIRRVSLQALGHEICAHYLVDRNTRICNTRNTSHAPLSLRRTVQNVTFCMYNVTQPLLKCGVQGQEEPSSKSTRGRFAEVPGDHLPANNSIVVRMVTWYICPLVSVKLVSFGFSVIS